MFVCLSTLVYSTWKTYLVLHIYMTKTQRAHLTSVLFMPLMKKESLVLTCYKQAAAGAVLFFLFLFDLKDQLELFLT